MTIGIVVFPGSNCDRDVRWALEGCLGVPTRFLWHEESDLQGLEAVVLPGGFSYGDYLRCGAIARFAPVLEEVRRFAAELKRFNGDLRERSASLMARFTALGDSWQDQEQEKFSGEFIQLMKTLKAFLELSERHTPYLLRKAERIQQYLDQR